MSDQLDVTTGATRQAAREAVKAAALASHYAGAPVAQPTRQMERSAYRDAASALHKETRAKFSKRHPQGSRAARNWRGGRRYAKLAAQLKATVRHAALGLFLGAEGFTTHDVDRAGRNLRESALPWNVRRAGQ
jgi:hypothetical protein